MSVKNIEELFVYDGREFVIEVYRNLLNRDPDEHGLAYYLGRLEQGHSKAEVIAQLAKSSECRPLHDVTGLKALSIDTQRKNFWLSKWFGYRSRIESAVYIGTKKLAQLDTQLANINMNLASLRGVLQATANDHIHLIKNLAGLVAQNQITSPDSDLLHDKPQKLLPETVTHIFMDILGRVPESTEVINQYAKLESPQALCDVLMLSDEFQTILANLPISARIIFSRRLYMQNAKKGLSRAYTH